MKTLKFYIASPLFTPDQIKLIDKYESEIKRLDYEYFSPRSIGSKYNFKGTDVGIKKLQILDIFHKNISNMAECTNMIAITKVFDIGTLFEIGFFLASRRGNLLIVEDECGIQDLMPKVNFLIEKSEKLVQGKLDDIDGVNSIQSFEGVENLFLSKKLNVISIDDRPAINFILMGILHFFQIPFITYSEKDYGSNIMISAISRGHLKNTSTIEAMNESSKFLVPTGFVRIQEAEDVSRAID